MTKKVFIINGSGGVGKDTFVKFVSEYAGVMNVSSVEEVKKFATMMGWNGEKDEKSRKFLSDLKDILTAYNDRPFTYLQRCVKDFMNDKVNEFCFIHIREPEEIQRAKEAFNATTVLVTRNTIEQVKGNHADEDVLKYTYDVQIENNSSLDFLKAVARKFVSDFRS